MQALKMVHTVDPAEEIRAEVQSYIEEIEVLGSQVLVAAYIRPEKTVGGIILPDTPNSARAEDEFQGKVGLVLKSGPIAFKDDDTHKFGDRIPQPGDWVLYRVGDTFPLKIGKRHCRFVEDVSIKAILKRPDSVL